MMSDHIIPMWHEWNANANDVMMMWLALYVNPSDVTSASMTHAHMHGTHALTKTGASK